MVRKEIIDSLLAYYPFLAEKAVSFVQTSPFDLIIKMEDGSSVLYDDSSKSFRTLPRDSKNMSERESKIEFGFRLRTVMERKGISQLVLSEMTGISQPILSNYLNGKNSPSFYKVDIIAKALGCSIDELTYRD